jgi:hypothetical protein
MQGRGGSSCHFLLGDSEYLTMGWVIQECCSSRNAETAELALISFFLFGLLILTIVLKNQ